MSPSSWDVAPHGIVMMAAAMLLIVLFVHILGFRIVGAVKVG
jgi:hypothetical protein